MIPYPLEPDREFPTLHNFSDQNPLAESGAEETRYELEEPVYDTEADLMTFQTDHFSGFDLLTAGELAYLVENCSMWARTHHSLAERG